jgi:hypothetical protein
MNSQYSLLNTQYYEKHKQCLIVYFYFNFFLLIFLRSLIMKKLIALIAIVVLSTSFAFAAFTPSQEADNNFTATVWCTYGWSSSGNAYLGNYWNDGNTYAIAIGTNGALQNSIDFTLTGQAGQQYTITGLPTGTIYDLEATGSYINVKWFYKNGVGGETSTWQDDWNGGTGTLIPVGLNCDAKAYLEVTALNFTAPAGTVPGTKTFKMTVTAVLSPSWW